MAKKYPAQSLMKMKKIELLAIADAEGLTITSDIHRSKLISILSDLELEPPPAPPPPPPQPGGAPPLEPGEEPASVRIRRIRDSHGKHYG